MEACRDCTSPEATPSQSTVSLDSGIVGHQECAVVSIIAASRAAAASDAADAASVAVVVVVVAAATAADGGDPPDAAAPATGDGDGTVMVAGVAVVGVAANEAVNNSASSSNPWVATAYDNETNRYTKEIVGVSNTFVHQDAE